MDKHSTPTARERWVRAWAEDHVFEADHQDTERPRQIVVSMFPYPSGDLHMGHAEAYSISDTLARYLRMRGNNVLNPIGWDSFGLPVETRHSTATSIHTNGRTPTSTCRPSRSATSASRSTGALVCTRPILTIIVGISGSSCGCSNADSRTARLHL